MSDPTALLEVEATATGLCLTGEIDASSAGLLSEHLDPLPGDTEEIELDLDAVRFIDSSGLRVLIDAHQRAERAGRRLVIARPSAVVRRLLEISGLTGYLVVR